MEASSESFRPPGECTDRLCAELHWGVLQNFLHTVTMTVARITARQREIPSTTIMLPPRGAIPTVVVGKDGDDGGNTEDKHAQIRCMAVGC